MKKSIIIGIVFLISSALVIAGITLSNTVDIEKEKIDFVSEKGITYSFKEREYENGIITFCIKSNIEGDTQNCFIIDDNNREYKEQMIDYYINKDIEKKIEEDNKVTETLPQIRITKETEGDIILR